MFSSFKENNYLIRKNIFTSKIFICFKEEKDKLQSV